MALVKIDIIGLFWLEDTNSQPIRVTQDSYLNLLKNDVLPCPGSRRNFSSVVYAGRGQLIMH